MDLELYKGRSSREMSCARGSLYRRNLDRCSPAITLEVLEAIKLYLNIEPLVFIVGLDRHVVDAIVGKDYEDKGLSPRKSEQYRTRCSR